MRNVKHRIRRYVKPKRPYNKKDHISSIVALFSAFVVIASVLFRSISFFLKKAYFDYFKIDIKFIEINYDSLLAELLAAVAAITIFTILSFLFIWWFKRKRKKLIRAAIIIAYTGALSLFNTVLIFNYFQDIYQDITKVSSGIFVWSVLNILLIIIEVVFDITIIPLYQFIDEQYISKNYKTLHRVDSQKRLLLSVLTSFFICCYLFGMSVYSYQYEKARCKDIKDFDIIEQSGNQYVVLTNYHDKYYAKPCLSYRVDLSIDNSKYVLFDMDEVIINKRSYEVVRMVN